MKYGGGDLSTGEPSHVPDKIKLSCFSKQDISTKSADLYVLGHSIRDISKQLGLAQSTIQKTLKLAGVAMRPSAQNLKNQNLKPTEHSIGVAPYGFSRLRGKLVVEPKEIRVVQIILDLWRSNKSFNAIAKHLNNQGIPTRKIGASWKHPVIQSIINRHKDNPNRIEEIITWASKN